MANSFPLSQEAKDKLREVSSQIRRSLVVVAREITESRDGTDAVQSTHIDEARQILAPQPQRQKNQRLDFAKFLAGVLIGTAIGGIFSAIVSGQTPNNLAIVVAIGMLFLGFMSAWYGYR